jgi:glucosamine-6-phosphate deaminase
MISKENIHNYCLDYEKKIDSFGGLDYQLLGIGRTGHIGFNEPGSHINSITRSITLDFLTRSDAASDFFGLDAVPKRAITMGIGSVLKSKRIVLLAWGNKKASIIEKTIEGNITSDVPATYLQNHNNTTFILDVEAASLLTRNKTPWLVRSCKWTPELIQKSVVWLSNKTNKSILKLTDNDYNMNGMSSLLAESGTAYDINIDMFNHFQHTITGWPGGKPNADDTYRPEREYPHKKRVLLFSPHPDDDVISMGGTLDRLISQGHEVHIAYQTSGSTAVSNIDALKFTEVAVSLCPAEINDYYTKMITNLKLEKTSNAIWNLKGNIRQKEALAAVRYLGMQDENIYFLKLPFYETGNSKKLPLSITDINITRKLIEKIKPHQIYVAGDLSDPHGTHKTCLDAVYQAIDEIKEKVFMKNCRVWLYRGAWQEWDINEIEMAVPLSPDQVLRKRKAIFFHQTQKDHVVYRGNDIREFWLRAEERNKETAKVYNEMGLADYEALEAFKQYHF